MDDTARAALLDRWRLRPLAGRATEAPPAWVALPAEGGSAAERVASVCSWWPDDVFDGFPRHVPGTGWPLVDVRPVLDRSGRDGRPVLAYVFRRDDGALGVLVGSPPARDPVHPLVPEPLRTLLADVHETFGGVHASFAVHRPGVHPGWGETLEEHTDGALGRTSSWPGLRVDGHRPPPHPRELVVVGEDEHAGWFLLLHPGLPAGRALAWTEMLSEIDLRDDVARLLASRITWVPGTV